MAGLGRSYALKLADERAKAQPTERQQWEAEAFAHSLFDNVWADGKAIDLWSHIPSLGLVDSVGKFNIDCVETKGCS